MEDFKLYEDNLTDEDWQHWSEHGDVCYFTRMFDCPVRVQRWYIAYAVNNGEEIFSDVVPFVGY